LVIERGTPNAFSLDARSNLDALLRAAAVDAPQIALNAIAGFASNDLLFAHHV
jgi:hypothetical protein